MDRIRSILGTAIACGAIAGLVLIANLLAGRHDCAEWLIAGVAALGVGAITGAGMYLLGRNRRLVPPRLRLVWSKAALQAEPTAGRHDCESEEQHRDP